MSNARYELNWGTGADESVMDHAVTRLRYCSTARYGGDWHSMLHTHDCTELFYVVGGGGHFRMEHQSISVAADAMVIVPPYLMHTEVSLEEHPMEYIVLGVDGLGWVGDFDALGCGTIDFRGCGEEMRFYLAAILRELEHKSEGYQRVCQNLLEVVLTHCHRKRKHVLHSLPAQPVASKECAIVRRYIDTHFKENISLELLADTAHLNKYYMVHAFSKVYGVPPIGYLIGRRIHESKALLHSTNHTLAQISQMLGFSSLSYFSQSFRKVAGMSPRDYRREWRNRKPEEGAAPDHCPQKEKIE